MGYSIQELPVEERPRERLLRHGPSMLSAGELLAIIISSGTQGASALQLGQELIVRFGGVPGVAEATVQELCVVKGLGKAKAIQIKAACQLGVFAVQEGDLTKLPLNHPKQVFQLLERQLGDLKQEHVVLLSKDTKGFLIQKETVSIGTLSESLIHPREVFYPAIRNKAASVIIVHNHPSGDPSPSPQDLSMTRTLVAAGDLIGIPVDDHIIIGKGNYTSLREQGNIAR